MPRPKSSLQEFPNFFKKIDLNIFELLKRCRVTVSQNQMMESLDKVHWHKEVGSIMVQRVTFI